MKADVTVKRGELVEKSLLAFDLLCYEDHYALPCKDMQDIIDESIQLIKHREIIYVKEEIQSEHFQEIVKCFRYKFFIISFVYEYRVD